MQMNDDQAINYLFDLSTFGWKLGLEKITAMLNELGNPQAKYRTIHIAGTNGKGSTSATIESILRAAGYKTGLYTSPHLVYVGERIRCDGQSIKKEDLVSYINYIKPLIEKYRCTFFEAMTIIAFLYFADQQVEIAVIEVGLGGRLDATNVITPLISIITNIDIDHTKQLGATRNSIAYEKAGIIKPDSICLATCQSKQVNSIIARICQDRNAEYFCVDSMKNIENIRLDEQYSIFDLTFNGTLYSQLKFSLAGEHQINNAALAIIGATIINARFFPISIEDIYRGLATVKWHGRLQLISDEPKILIDAAHNPGGISVLTKALRTIFRYHRLIVVFGVCKDKDYRSMLKKLAPLSDIFIAVKANEERGLSTSTIAKYASLYIDSVNKKVSVTAGLEYAMQCAQQNDLILCTGSHYVLNDILVYFNQVPN
ncbi:MAG: bifunctional folylpolyglutamate synthase/dihydrofolate synthase [bacterium]|nr:bifunctional folylpolyglutamate synthase/dihydrofolate synthase [bacterium]